MIEVGIGIGEEKEKEAETETETDVKVTNPPDQVTEKCGKGLRLTLTWFPQRQAAGTLAVSAVGHWEKCRVRARENYP